ncbi:30S ribosomal protein S21 [Candidatus Berkelbacteria bacterium CG10_big_fil_rev_8_21_14_0_10_43_13]|uniref:Small ribosomal subunit protein bS21 n=1 Tax=Candidatus Berkelbacteria bacterium CG10_big_fil_rev_8_21_14_0_10_43_13 TaxID=1974514 RepID=A0A2H0W697_9BACT|nr:MAG: 30S ribosomal protein S21 [Candidatus Berkelbacteria bacterium CG10_big_fil_rev_8_21_14_0_10_43_13]
MIEVKKKGNERIDVLVRRFNREVQQSGILTVAKDNRFFSKELNRGSRRKIAVRRTEINKLKRGW